VYHWRLSRDGSGEFEADDVAPKRGWVVVPEHRPGRHELLLRLQSLPCECASEPMLQLSAGLQVAAQGSYKIGRTSPKIPMRLWIRENSSGVKIAANASYLAAHMKPLTSLAKLSSFAAIFLALTLGLTAGTVFQMCDMPPHEPGHGCCLTEGGGAGGAAPEPLSLSLLGLGVLGLGYSVRRRRREEEALSEAAS